MKCISFIFQIKVLFVPTSYMKPLCNTKAMQFVLYTSLPLSMASFTRQLSIFFGNRSEPIHCTLLYFYSDVFRIKQFMKSDQDSVVKSENFSTVISYCENLEDCRKELLLTCLSQASSERFSCNNNVATQCSNCKHLVITWFCLFIICILYG